MCVQLRLDAEQLQEKQAAEAVVAEIEAQIAEEADASKKEALQAELEGRQSVSA